MRTTGRLLVLFLLLLGAFLAYPQSWAPFNESERFDYRLGSDPIPRFGLRVDSTSYDDVFTTWYLPSKPEPCDTCPGYDSLYCPNILYYPGLPQFLQRQVTPLSNGNWVFSDTGNFVIKTRATLGENWLFDPAASISASVTVLGDSLIFGNLDSIKIISLSTGPEIILSKEHGILQFPTSLQSIGSNYQLSGIAGRNLGNYIPGWREIYSMQPGDAIQYREYKQDFKGFDREETISLRYFTDRNDYADSVVLTYRDYVKVYFNTSFIGGGEDKFCSYVDEGEMTLKDPTGPAVFNQGYHGYELSDLTNYDWFENNGATYWFYHAKSHLTYTTDSTGRFKKVNICGGYEAFDDSEEGIVSFSGGANFEYTEGLGFSHGRGRLVWGLSGLDGFWEFDITAYMQGMDTVGNLMDTAGWTPINELHAIKLQIHPNPVVDRLELRGLEGANLGVAPILHISDAAGNLRIRSIIAAPSPTIDVSQLPAGIYFIAIIGEEKPAIGKFCKF